MKKNQSLFYTAPVVPPMRQVQAVYFILVISKEFKYA